MLTVPIGGGGVNLHEDVVRQEANHVYSERMRAQR
jgi:hypothetical protein